MSVSYKNPEFELIPCPICGGQEFTHLFHKKKEPFVRCIQCHFTLINPRPSFEKILKTYDSVYSGNYTKKAGKKRKRALRRVKRLKNSYGLFGNWLDVGCSAGFVVEAAQSQGFFGYGPFFTSVSQLSPDHPSSQVQLYPLVASVQVAPLRQGLLAHSSISCTQLLPANPSTHSHWYMFGGTDAEMESEQSPPLAHG